MLADMYVAEPVPTSDRETSEKNTVEFGVPVDQVLKRCWISLGISAGRAMTLSHICHETYGKGKLSMTFVESSVRVRVLRANFSIILLLLGLSEWYRLLTHRTGSESWIWMQVFFVSCDDS